MSCGCSEYRNNEHRNNFVSDKQSYDCGADRQVIKHNVVVKHQHDIIHEYDVVHEHEYNYYDVVKTSEVSKKNDYRSHKPNYCEEDNCKQNFVKSSY